MLRVEQVRMAVAAPREAEALPQEALAELDDAPAIHREEVVVEEDVAHAEAIEAPADGDHPVDAVEAPFRPDVERSQNVHENGQPRDVTRLATGVAR
jgi:hypothetical protein